MEVTSQVLNQVTGVKHGFGTRDQPLPSIAVSAGWQSIRPHWEQVHGASFAEVKKPGQDCGKVDALYCRISIPIGIITADCVPILMAHHTGSCVAAVHAGWRGTRAQILRVLWEQLKIEGEKPSEWVAAVGPAIGPCCYEVSPELAAEFPNAFVKGRFLDLPGINAALLKDIGLAQVDLIRACTLCSTQPRFNSYRGKDLKSRQWSVISRISKPLKSAE